MFQLTRKVIPVLSICAVLALTVGAQPSSKAQAEILDQSLSGGMTREEMAALYPALAAAQVAPPACVPGQEMFIDVPASHPACPWIEELARRGITGGCNATSYCPAAPVDRAQMAVFLVRAVQAAGPGIPHTVLEEFTAPQSGIRTENVFCPDGELATGGGYDSSPFGSAVVHASIPVPAAVSVTEGWAVRFSTPTGPATVRVFAVCVPITE